MKIKKQTKNKLNKYIFVKILSKDNLENNKTKLLSKNKTENLDFFFLLVF